MSSSPVTVAVGVLRDAQDRILISRRPEHVHQGGCWEFPGGKCEAGESVQLALARELQEELGIKVTQSRPLIRIPYTYPEKSVVLEVRSVSAYSGEPQGREGQALRWVSPEALTEFQFPPANLPIIRAVRLPERYLITGAFRDPTDCMQRLTVALDGGIRLVQLRAGQLTEPDYIALARQAASLCREYQAVMLINADLALLDVTEANGVHLNSTRLMACTARPLPEQQWLAASVHNHQELQHAMAIRADFVVTSPVLPTTSHPGAATLGWDGLQALTDAASCPVFALGGMQAATLPEAWHYGAQGIAAISAFWPEGK